jgi:hypothetical protein
MSYMVPTFRKTLPAKASVRAVVGPGERISLEDLVVVFRVFLCTFESPEKAQGAQRFPISGKPHTPRQLACVPRPMMQVIAESVGCAALRLGHNAVIGKREVQKLGKCIGERHIVSAGALADLCLQPVNFFVPDGGRSITRCHPGNDVDTLPERCR